MDRAVSSSSVRRRCSSVRLRPRLCRRRPRYWICDRRMIRGIAASRHRSRCCRRRHRKSGIDDDYYGLCSRNRGRTIVATVAALDRHHGGCRPRANCLRHRYAAGCHPCDCEEDRHRHTLDRRNLLDDRHRLDPDRNDPDRNHRNLGVVVVGCGHHPDRNRLDRSTMIRPPYGDHRPPATMARNGPRHGRSSWCHREPSCDPCHRAYSRRC
mmetsp:Transcript_33408/g.80793  ORF Transcript_33408/g.80793 Transcript_33408/m.80793 type:complete len:211 (+) Transcript_33408:394-1026(+)